MEGVWRMMGLWTWAYVSATTLAEDQRRRKLVSGLHILRDVSTYGTTHIAV